MDDDILDLPIGRIRQVVAAIVRRSELNERRKRAYVTWQTKTLAAIITSTSELTKDGYAKMQELIRSLSMELGDEAERLPEVADPEDDENALKRAAMQNRTGSFERLHGGLSPRRR